LQAAITAAAFEETRPSPDGPGWNRHREMRSLAASPLERSLPIQIFETGCANL